MFFFLHLSLRLFYSCSKREYIILICRICEIRVKSNLEIGLKRDKKKPYEGKNIDMKMVPNGHCIQIKQTQNVLILFFSRKYQRINYFNFSNGKRNIVAFSLSHETWWNCSWAARKVNENGLQHMKHTNDFGFFSGIKIARGQFYLPWQISALNARKVYLNIVCCCCYSFLLMANGTFHVNKYILWLNTCQKQYSFDSKKHIHSGIGNSLCCDFSFRGGFSGEHNFLFNENGFAICLLLNHFYACWSVKTNLLTFFWHIVGTIETCGCVVMRVCACVYNILVCWLLAVNLSDYLESMHIWDKDLLNSNLWFLVYFLVVLLFHFLLVSHVFVVVVLSPIHSKI